jgi:hypothetical protein
MLLIKAMLVTGLNKLWVLRKAKHCLVTRLTMASQQQQSRDAST